MNREARLIKHFGWNPDFPLLAALQGKISGITLSRIYYRDVVICTHCFPHGYECPNSSKKNTQRSWKKYRSTQYKQY